MWLLTIVVTLGALGILAFAGHLRAPRRDDRGWMSQRWLAEYRANDQGI